jgi:hypothetical protein
VNLGGAPSLPFGYFLTGSLKLFKSVARDLER